MPTFSPSQPSVYARLIKRFALMGIDSISVPTLISILRDLDSQESHVEYESLTIQSLYDLLGKAIQQGHGEDSIWYAVKEPEFEGFTRATTVEIQHFDHLSDGVYLSDE